MRIRGALIVAAAAAAGFGLAGCPSSSCPMETPQVNAIPNCTEPPNQAVSYEVRLCPTCNQTGATCAVQIAGNSIFFDIKVEACNDASSCGGAGCAQGPTMCNFTTPATPDTYNITATDAGGTITGTLVVSAGATPSCAFPAAGI